MISFLGGGSNEIGTATTNLTATPGLYDLVVGYVEENDGKAQLEVKLNGNSLDSWILNQDISSDRPASDNFLRRTVAEDLRIEPGNQLEILGIEDLTEHGRVDYIELIPVVSNPPELLPEPEPIPVPSPIPIPIPTPQPGQSIRIEAEDYGSSSQGMAYFDTSPGNIGGEYRSNDVDLQTTTDKGGGYNLGWIDQGEWLTYDVNIPQTGQYDIIARVTSNWGFDHQLRYSLGEQQGIFEFDGTAGWQNWIDVEIPDVALNAGQQTLRLEALSSNFNLNYIDLVPTSKSIPEPTPEPEPNPLPVEIGGELKKWHPIDLTFDGPQTSETDSLNPFLDYRLDVTFTNGEKNYGVPGYYAADGDAAETSAAEGNKWRVHFTPDEIGTWTKEERIARKISSVILSLIIPSTMVVATTI
ncbi:MAG: DUF5060 domain-containing protein [Oscillatoriales cyanobacterium RM1_1_9]|nr:DUF5060 domain-containing protein [Oscillatoriales cyanobacterium SM2_3_0]NJO45687.1 DUF5060 domain-containing protein [Oscillatoriales cyanobacterium RM2_1_1]NJO70521.1 DUF5060 domain-containing protein [Oscillatoriales cyanobacterium RM1_1_9]